MLFITYTDEVRQNRADEATAALKQTFSNMAGKIPGLRKAEFGKNIAGGRYDACLYCEFDKPEDIPAYRLHPLHSALEEMANSWVKSNACVDYIVDEQ